MHMMLATIRKAQGLSQRELAERVGVDQSTVHRAEHMARSATMATYRDCAQALNVPVQALFADSPEEVVLLTAFRDSDDRARSLLLSLAQDAAAHTPPHFETK